MRRATWLGGMRQTTTTLTVAFELDPVGAERRVERSAPGMSSVLDGTHWLRPLPSLPVFQMMRWKESEM